MSNFLLVFILVVCTQVGGYLFKHTPKRLIHRLKFEVKGSLGRDVLTSDCESKVQLVPVKELSRLLKIDAKDILNDVTMKHNKHWYCKFDGVWHQYETQKEVLIPMSFVVKYAAKRSRSFDHPISLTDLRYIPPAKVNALKIPVVAVLGHFNHGKTSLIDHYCNSNIAENEVHSITQVVRTRMIELEETQMTLVDTPGQEIFYRMRNTGASIADVAILVIAADSGVCLQTEESIGILESLGRPVVVCINKVDKVTKQRIAEVEREIRQFVALEDAPIVPISASSGENIDALTSHLLTAIRNLTLSTSSSSAANAREEIRHVKECSRWFITGSGSVLNQIRSRQNGTMLHVLVQQGQVSVGDSFSSGGWSGWVREVVHDNQQSVSSAAGGRGVYLKVALQGSSGEPKPLGQRIFFHSAVKDKSKARGAAEEAARFRQLERLFEATALTQSQAEELWLERTAARVARKKFDLDLSIEAGADDDESGENNNNDDDDNDDDGNEDSEEENEDKKEETASSPEGKVEEQLVIIKADSDLSLETILDAHFDAQEAWKESIAFAAGSAAGSTAKKEAPPPPPMKVVRSAVGDVTLNDVVVAGAAGALIVTYGVGCDSKTAQSAAKRGVSVSGFECLQDAISLVTSSFVRPTHYEDFSSMMIRPKRRSSLFD